MITKSEKLKLSDAIRDINVCTIMVSSGISNNDSQMSVKYMHQHNLSAKIINDMLGDNTATYYKKHPSNEPY